MLSGGVVTYPGPAVDAKLPLPYRCQDLVHDNPPVVLSQTGLFQDKCMDVLRVGRQMNLRLEQHYTPDTAAASILLCKNRITVGHGNEGNLFPVHAEDDHIQATVIQLQVLEVNAWESVVMYSVLLWIWAMALSFRNAVV